MEAWRTEFLHSEWELNRRRLLPAAWIGLVVIGSLMAADWLLGNPRFDDLALPRVLTLLVCLTILSIHHRQEMTKTRAPLRFVFIMVLGFQLSMAAELSSPSSPAFGWLGLVVLGLALIFPFRRGEMLAVAGGYCALGAITVWRMPEVEPSEIIYPAAQLVSASVIAIVISRITKDLKWREFVKGKELAAEKKVTERLLRNMLPIPIADRLKDGEHNIADGHAAVTVLFADISGFTAVAAAEDPHEVVALLNRLFSAFDGLVARRKLEKIKTVGDAYMVAGGLPTARSDHAGAVASLALDMREEGLKILKAHGDGLSLRIGIHTGPVVAGVIGKSKYSYDLWGDTVNMAARMESHAPLGTIQMSSATRELLEESFQCKSRGKIDVRSMGKMETWLLEGAAHDRDR